MCAHTDVHAQIDARTHSATPHTFTHRQPLEARTEVQPANQAIEALLALTSLGEVACGWAFVGCDPNQIEYCSMSHIARLFICEAISRHLYVGASQSAVAAWQWPEAPDC